MSNDLTEAERQALDAWTPMAPPSGFADRVLGASAVPLPPRRLGRNIMIVGITIALAAAFALVLIGLRRERGPAPLAELSRAEGPVERQEGTSAWGAVSVGAKLYLGDAVRTADGGADLVIAGRARLAMQPHTVLRFGGDQKTSQISVEVGSVELTGTGIYGFDIGDVTLATNAGVRISARGRGQAEIELTIGDAKITTNGETIALAIGRSVEVGLAVSVVTVIDAGLAEVPRDMSEGEGFYVVDPTIAVTGKRVEVQHAGMTTWELLPPGAGAFRAGDRIRVGAGSTVQLTSGDVVLDLAAGGRATLGEDRRIALEAGPGRITSVGSARLALAGGELELPGASNETAEAKVDANARETKVTITRGAGKLTGTGGGELAMNRGESATLARTGTIRVLEAIPSYFDLRAAVGDTFTIHDPRGLAAVQFQFGGKCAQGGIVELDRDARFRTARISAGKDSANLGLSSGSWAYRLRCTTNGVDGPAVASGRIAVVRDSGNRALPKQAATNEIDADGRNYRVSYQSVIPSLIVRAKGTATVWRLHMATGGKAEVFESKTGLFKVPTSKLQEGSYTYWVERDGVKDTKVSTLVFQFDNTAPQVYIESPRDGVAWTAELDVRGAVLPDWTATIDGIAIPMDRQRRFAAKVNPPSGARALSIVLSHPKRGVHIYLRRGK